MREPLSITIITKNEEKRIAKCLDSVSFADEILVVDSGSTDRTVEIARQYGARVIQQSWLGYGRQKQFAVDQAKNDWVLSLDADEWLSIELAISIQKALSEPVHMVYRVARRNKFLGRWLAHGEGYPDISTRLFHRGYASWSFDAVHERVISSLNPGRISGDLMHESEDGLGMFLRKQVRYAEIQSHQLIESHGLFWVFFKLLTSPFSRFVKNYLIRLGFLDGYQGLVFSLASSYATFKKYSMALTKAFHFQRDLDC